MRKVFYLMILTTSAVFSQCPEGLITSEQNLVKNGDFEETTTPFDSDY